MTLIQNIMNKIGFKTDSSSDVCGCDVQIKDGCVVGVPYAELSGKKVGLTQNELIAAYQKVSCVGSSIDLISNNMQMVEPIFWNNLNRDVIEYPDNDKKLKNFRRILEKPNAFMNRKTFIDMCVKEYVVHGSIWFAFIMDGKNIISIKPISSNLISLFEDVEGNRIGSLTVTNAGNYSGTYLFDGRYYTKEDDKRFVIAPLINSSTAVNYLPASLLVGTGVEVLLYWYGCFHNKSLLQNGARPSLIFLIKSMLNPKHKEQLKKKRLHASNQPQYRRYLKITFRRHVPRVAEHRRPLNPSKPFRDISWTIYIFSVFCHVLPSIDIIATFRDFLSALRLTPNP